MAGCTSHHIWVDLLDKLLKEYVYTEKENSAEMLEQLNASIKNETVEVKNNEETAAILQRQAYTAFCAELQEKLPDTEG